MAELHENERQSLIQKLHDSVKQCQAAFGDKKSSLATESDSSVACVIVHFEQVLLHGLKRSRVWEKITSITEPLRQVTQKMLPEIELTFWSLLKEYLGSLDIQHFQNLEGITTDSGRARVWLRTAINENTLENHLNSILGHKTLRSHFYEPWALMMDEERASTVPTMARGLGSILFAIDTKSTELNRPFKNVHTTYSNEQEFRTHRRIKSSPLPVMAEILDNVTTPNEPIRSRRKKKKRKVVEATISDMNDGHSSSLIHTHTAPNLNEVKEDNELYYSSTPDLFMNTDDKQLKIDVKESGGIEESLVQHDKVETSIIDYNYNDEHILKLGVSNDFHPQQDIIMDSVDPSIYSVDYENECVAAQLETLNILPPSNIPFEDECEKNTDKLIEHTNSEISDKASLPPLSSSTEMSYIDDELLDDNSNPNSLESFTDMVSDYMQNTTTGEVPVDIDDVNKNDAAFRSEDNQDGYENTTYLQILAFDQESSQAANDTLALVSASNSNSMFQLENEVDADEPPACPEIDKYVPKVDHQLHENPGGQMTTLSTGDLKKAILATAKKKDEIEEKRRLLQCAFDEQQEELQSLRLENEKIRSDFEEKETQHEIKVEHLNQEIDFLKKQLKKYVSSIQTLGKDGNNCAETAKPTFHNQAKSTERPEESAEMQSNMDEKIFEERLQQMAQMHGELMEFQESLQKQLISKNHEISQLKEQLISLRGPLPDDDNVSHESVESTYSPSKMLINIWIPSVFLKTKGTESYHLYQVYVHVGNDEWNIYRRYSQFNKLHIEVCKSHPSLEKFDFPKKKIFGKKDEKLVEKRRHQFQEYLRTVINTLITSKSMLSSNASRRKLIELLPFFGENYDEESDRKKKAKKNKNTESTPHYSGL